MVQIPFFNFVPSIVPQKFFPISEFNVSKQNIMEQTKYYKNGV